MRNERNRTGIQSKIINQTNKKSGNSVNTINTNAGTMADEGYKRWEISRYHN